MLTKCKYCETKILKKDKCSHEKSCHKKPKKTTAEKVKEQCPDCKKEYVNLKRHKCREKKKGRGKKSKRPPINKRLRMDVWIKYAGNHFKTKCFCCCIQDITSFTGVNAYEAGHIISDKNGGKEVIGNLLPICRSCNNNMSAENWSDYVERHGLKDHTKHGLDLAYYSRYEKGIIWWQSLFRMYLSRKNKLQKFK